MRKIYFLLLTVLFAAMANAQNVTVNPGAGSYPTLKDAFDAINAGTHTGAVTVNLVGNTTETLSASLNASGTGAASYTSIVISPSGGAARTISGAITGNLINLNGADNVTIDGLNTGGNSLTISNTATGASNAIRFIADASNNIIQNCTLQGSASTASNGVVFFSTGTTTGNDGNNINNCNITAAGANLPINGIFSLGTSAAIDNGGNTVTNNNIFDYFHATTATAGININTNNSTWTITNNRLYQTATRQYTTGVSHRGINITTGSGYTITGNMIGYANSSGTGTTNMVGNSVALAGFPGSYTVSGTANATTYIAISCAFTAGGTVSEIQNNTIAGFALYTSSSASTTTGIFCGIGVTSGNVNIGTTTGNTIGSTSGNGSIYAATTTTAGTIVGIYVTSTNTVNIQNNTFGAIDAMGTTSSISGGITGINSAGTAGNFSVTDNIIGNTTNPNLRMGNLTTGGNLSNTGTTFGIATGTGTFTGILNSATGTVTISDNTIRNASANTSATGSSYRGINTSGGTYVISGNSINNLTSASTNTTVATGLLAGVGILGQGGTAGSVITQNTINTLGLSNTTTNGTNVAGISLSNTAVDVTRNRIYDLSNASTSATATAPGTASGIFIRSGTAGENTNIMNNMISLGNGQTTNTSFIGIWANHGSSPNPNDNIYFNSVNIEGVAASGANPSFGFHRGNFATTPVNLVVVDIRNNIFTNSRTGGTGNHYAIGNLFNATTVSATGWAANASDYNILNSADPATIGHWQTAQNFAGWQAASLSDNNSISGATINFVNTATGDLHITTPFPSVVDAAGVDIPAITMDFDGQLRASLTPVDIGADAGIFSNSPVIVFTPLSTICTTGPRTLTATITDPDGVPTVGIGLPVLYWRINAGVYTPATATFLGSDQFQFTFGGGAVLGDIISYYIAAQDNLGNVGTSPLLGASGFTPNPPAASTPPTMPRTYLIAPTLSGTYTVGVGGNFATLTEAVNAYNTYCIGGAIVFNLIDATYPSETFPITINQNAAASSVNTLTIKPNTTATLSGSVASNAILRILGNYVTIDGSNNGTTSRDLTITNTSTTSPSVVLIGSTGTTPVMNSGLKNSIVINGANTATAVVVSDAASLGAAGYFNNITIQNNSVQRAFIGIYSIAVVAAGNGSGLAYMNNDLTTSGANSIRLAGLYVQGVDGATVSNNMIGNIANSVDASNLTGIWFATGTVNSTISGNTISEISGTSTAPRGIALSPAVAASNNTISGNTIMGLTSSSSGITYGIYLFSTTGGITIQNNKVRDIKNTNATSTGAYGISLSTTTTNADVSVINNFVSDVASSGSATSTANGVGIAVTAGSGYSIYFNTVHLNTDQISSAGIPAAINITSGVTAAGAINLRNNIFTNSQTVGTNRYAIYSGAANTVFAAIDYNDYYSVGPNLGFIGSNRVDLAAIQAGFGGNTNSLSVQPVFMTAQDLHLNPAFNNSLNNLATPIGGITTDIDNDTRNAVNPDMGADEFDPCSPPATATASNNGPICAGSTLNLTGTTDGNIFSWTGPNGFTSALQNPSIPNATIAASGVYTFQAYLAGCPSLASTTTVVVNPSPIISSISATPSTICLNGNSQLQVNASLYTDIAYTKTDLTGQTYTTLSGPGITVINDNSGLSSSMSNNQDDGAALITLPFTFTYAGVAFNQMTMCTNGWLGAGNQLSVSAIDGRAAGNLFTPTVPNNTIAAWFKDMGANFPTTQPGTGPGSMRHGLIGTDVYSFQWDQAVGSGFSISTTILISFQINIYGPASTNPGRIEIIYGPTLGAISFSASIGIEDAIGGVGHYLNALTGNSTSTTTSIAWPGNGNGYSFDPIFLNYLWSPSTFLNDPTIPNPLASNITATTAYNVVVGHSVNSCTATANVTVTMGSPDVSSVVVQPTTCVSTDGSITLTVSGGGGGPYTYAWTGPGVNPTSQNQSGLMVGSYDVTVTDQASGCTTVVNFALSGPGGCSVCPTIGGVTTNPTPNACAGAPMTFTASGLTDMGVTYGITFKYSSSALPDPYVGGTVIGTVPNGSLGSGGTIATFNGSIPTAGSYFVYAILSPTPVDVGCRPSVSTSLTVNPIPDGMVVTIPGTLQVQITGNGNWADEITWTLRNSSNTIILSGGPYGFDPGPTLSGTAPAANGPFTFFIEAEGFFNDNSCLWEVRCDGVVVASGCIRGTSNGTACPNVGTLTVPNISGCGTSANQTVCTGQPITPISFTGSVSGTVFNWTRDNVGTVTGTIGASGSGTISGTLINSTTAPITVTFTITPEANGCSGTPFTATVTVNPTPTITCPANITVNNTPGQCGAFVNYPPPTVTGTPAPTVTYSHPSGSLFPVGTTTVTVTATNACGTVSCTFTVTVNDTQPPTITCPANMTVPNDLNQCSAVVNYPTPATSDNCGSGTVSDFANPWTNTGQRGVFFDISNIGTIPITITAFNPAMWGATAISDAFSVYFTTSATTWNGNQANAGAWTLNTTANVSFPGGANPIQVSVPLTTPIVLAPGQSRGVYIVGTLAFGGGPNAYLSTPAYAGPQSYQDGNLRFTGGIGSGALFGTFFGDGSPTNFRLYYGSVTYSSPVPTALVSGIPSGGTFPIGTTTNVWMATDGVGNTSTCSFTVTVNDTQAPAITCPANITQATPIGSCTAVVNYTVTATDNCPGVTTALVSGPASGSAFPLGTTTVRWRATDAAGNTSTCQFTVTVTDAQIPVISVQPADVEACVGSNAVFTVTAAPLGGPNNLTYQWEVWNPATSTWVAIGSTSANPNLTVPNVTMAMAGTTYRVRVIGLCTTITSGMASLRVKAVPTVSLSTSRDPALTPGQLVNITASVSVNGGTIQWYKNGVPMPIGSVFSLMNLSVDDVGTYHVVYTALNGCTVTSNTVIVSKASSNDVFVYPNPNNGQFQVRVFETNTQLTITVYNSAGAMVYQRSESTGATPYTRIDVNMSAMAAGQYIVEVRDSGGNKIGVQQIVVWR